MNMSSYGERIMLARKRAGLTQTALAEEIGISRNWLLQIEKAQLKNITVGMIERIGQRLNVWPDYIMPHHCHVGTRRPGRWEDA